MISTGGLRYFEVAGAKCIWHVGCKAHLLAVSAVSLSEEVSGMVLDMTASPELTDAAAAVQELWCGVKRMDGTFLHSPLLEELKSLEVRLVRQAYRLRKGKDSADSSVDSRAAAAAALQSVHSVSVDLPVQVCRLWLHMCHGMQLGPDED